MRHARAEEIAPIGGIEGRLGTEQADLVIEDAGEDIFGDRDFVLVHVADGGGGRQLVEGDAVDADARALQQATLNRGDVGGVEADRDGGIDDERCGARGAGGVVEDDLGGEAQEALQSCGLSLGVADETDAHHAGAPAIALPVAISAVSVSQSASLRSSSGGRAGPVGAPVTLRPALTIDTALPARRRRSTE